MTPRWRTRLDLLTTVVLLFASAVVIWDVTTRVRRDRASSGGVSVLASDLNYKVGDSFARIDRDGSVDTERLYIFIRSTCVYCTASMDFYRRLSQQVSSEKVVFVGTEPYATLVSYLDVNGVNASNVHSVRSSQLRLTGTPAIVHVER